FFFSRRRRHTRCYRDWSSDVCSSDLQIYVSEYGAMERVQRFQIVPESALVPGFQRPFPLTPALSPEEREKAPSGRTAASIQFLDSFGHAGTGPGEFNRPEGLCVDAQDRVYIADSCNHRIPIFSWLGNFR